MAADFNGHCTKNRMTSHDSGDRGKKKAVLYGGDLIGKYYSATDWFHTISPRVLNVSCLHVMFWFLIAGPFDTSLGVAKGHVLYQAYLSEERELLI